MTRRGLLGLGAAVIASGGAAGAGWLTAPKPRQPVTPPPRRAPVLEAELIRERAVLTRLDVAAAAEPALAARIAVLRSDHAEHVAAIVALLAAVGVPAPSGPSGPSGPSASTSPLPRPLVSVGELRAAESAAATAAASACAELTGAAAATLASISASESVHVAWLA